MVDILLAGHVFHRQPDVLDRADAVDGRLVAVFRARGRVVGEELHAVDAPGVDLALERLEDRVERVEGGVDQDEAVGEALVGDAGVDGAELGLVADESGREVGGGVLAEHEDVDVGIDLGHRERGS
jgi:hypothetical protein